MNSSNKLTTDTTALRHAFSAFATGVTVITTLDDQAQAVGMTANSFGSVSLEPPLVQWSLRLNSGLHRAFVTASHFSVSVLSADQEAIARQFASRAANRFEGVSLIHMAGAPPLIAGALAHFICKKVNEFRVGDHELFVGEVIHAAAHTDERFDHAVESASPLLFFNSKFGQIR